MNFCCMAVFISIPPIHIWEAISSFTYNTDCQVFTFPSFSCSRMILLIGEGSIGIVSKTCLSVVMVVMIMLKGLTFVHLPTISDYFCQMQIEHLVCVTCCTIVRVSLAQVAHIVLEQLTHLFRIFSVYLLSISSMSRIGVYVYPS